MPSGVTPVPQLHSQPSPPSGNRGSGGLGSAVLSARLALDRSAPVPEGVSEAA
jgi:hypothetical protein